MLPVYAQMRENARRANRAFSPIFEVSPEKNEFERQRRELEKEKSDWEERKAQWIQMAVVEKRRSQEEARNEFERQRREWEQEKSDWEERKAQWIQMAVVEEERRQEEEKGRENERNEWRSAAKREEDRRVLERTIAFEEASRLAIVKLQEEYEERSRLLHEQMREKIRLLEAEGELAKAKMEEEMDELHEMAGSCPLLAHFLPPFSCVFVQRISACVTNKTDFQPELLQVLGS
jgi:hypothetical protein